MTRTVRRWGWALCLALVLTLTLAGCQTAKHACRHHGGVAGTHNQWAICKDGSWHSMAA